MKIICPNCGAHYKIPVEITEKVELECNKCKQPFAIKPRKNDL